MKYRMSTVGERKDIHAPLARYEGMAPNGETIDFTNYYMRHNGKPFFAASGEMHFSRIDPRFWEDEIIKLKMGGITMVSTYLFWIHHEEVKGVFNWNGNCDLHRFLEICRKQKMWVLLRVGPFSHGECRNGGLPDWMYGAPYDVRSNDPEYLFYVRRYFEQIAEQTKGMYFKDGGPIVSIQIENEYEHASSPWEMTTENSGEWTVSGNDGISHFEILKKMLVELGMITPLYSTTAWGGACYSVKDVVPLWGGYAFRPWIFYGDGIKEHPPTDEFIYRNFHNNSAPMYYNFDPTYPAEDLPFVCCEMGGGMACYYRYRFQIDYESVEALANVKAAGGCNFLGYYMFHGGSNPKGKTMPYLNECGVPKISYDYQAAVGEFGQLRPSYHMVKPLHYMFEDFSDVFCGTKTLLPAGMDQVSADDTHTLRWCVRAGEKGSFLFINNYQDHAVMSEKTDVEFELITDEGIVHVPQQGKLSIADKATAILPYHWQMTDDLRLRSATVQAITCLENKKEKTFFFYTPAGMKPTIALEGDVALTAPGSIIKEDGCTLWNIPADETVCAQVQTKDGVVRLFVLSQSDRMRFWRAKRPDGDYAFLCSQSVLFGEDGLRIESVGASAGELAVFPSRKQITVNGMVCSAKEEKNGFAYFDVSYGEYHPGMTWEDASSKDKEGAGDLRRPVVGSPITSSKVVNARAKVHLTPEDFKGVKQTLLRIDYEGDIGYAFHDGDLMSDNFCNGAPWEFGLKAYEKEVLDEGLYIYVSPIRKGSKVNSASSMAARFETFDHAHAKIRSIDVVPVFDVKIDL